MSTGTANTLIHTAYSYPGFIWLDSSDHLQSSRRWSIIGIDPLKVVTTWKEWQSLTHDLDKTRGLTPPPVAEPIEAPFHTGILGFLSYEVASNWLPSSLFHTTPNFPQIYGGLYHQVILIDHDRDKAYYIQTHYPNKPAPLSLHHLIQQITQNNPLSEGATAGRQTERVKGEGHYTQIQKQTYLQKIETAKSHIKSGNIYQLNLSHQMTSLLSESPFNIYLKLRTQCPVPYAAYINTGTHHILSASPETLFKTDGNIITTRPIKGTIKRGDTPGQDQQNQQTLLASAKDAAELMMITDLERNDLGKICSFGSVQVPQIKTLETYPNLHHLVSTITGTLLPNTSCTDILQALFPGGSITGAPKQRAMDIIHDLESTPRHIYTGSIGYYDITQKSEFNIAIRTMYTIGNTLHFHSGGGIVADSNPNDEWEETLTKVSPLINTLTKNENPDSQCP